MAVDRHQLGRPRALQVPKLDVGVPRATAVRHGERREQSAHTSAAFEDALEVLLETDSNSKPADDVPDELEDEVRQRAEYGADETDEG